MMRKVRRIQMRNHTQPPRSIASANSFWCRHLQPKALDDRSARLRKIRNLIIFPANHAQMRNGAPIRP
jgi:hypothetical protein